MKYKKILLITVCAILFSCGKKYTCEVVHHTGIGAGVDVTTKKTFRGSYKKMLEFEKANTNEEKTTTCH